jgi:hypothetical protein
VSSQCVTWQIHTSCTDRHSNIETEVAASEEDLNQNPGHFVHRYLVACEHAEGGEETFCRQRDYRRIGWLLTQVQYNYHW